MDKPDRPMSLSPPSPKQRGRGSRAVTTNRPPPGACKAAPGYINIPEKKQSSSSSGPTPPRKLSNFNIYNSVIVEGSTNEDANNLEDYQNVQEIILSERNNTHNNIKYNEEPSHNSLLNRQLPDLLTSSRVNKNPAEVNPKKSHQKTAINHSKDGCSSNSHSPDSPKNCGSPTSYVNVNQYRKRSLVKESVIINLSKSGFPELVNSTAENKTQGKPQPPSFQNKPKATLQKQLTETNLSDTYKIRADLYSVDAIKQGNLDQKHRKLSPPAICEESFDGHTSRKVSMPTTDIATQPTSSQFLTTGRIQMKHQLKNAGGKKNQRSRSHSYQEEAGVYQNCMAFSKSETKLPQHSPVGSTHRSTTDIQSTAANDSDTAADFQATNLIRKIEQREKLTSQPSKVSVGLPNSPLKTNFGSIPNMGSTEELSEIRSKLRKVN